MVDEMRAVREAIQRVASGESADSARIDKLTITSQRAAQREIQLRVQIAALHVKHARLALWLAVQTFCLTVLGILVLVQAVSGK